MEILPLFYQNIINDVISKCISKKQKNASILDNLKQLWLRKLLSKGDNFIDLDILLQKEEKPVVARRRRLVKVKPMNGYIKPNSFYTDEFVTPCKRNMPDISSYSITPNILIPIEESEPIKSNSDSKFGRKTQTLNSFVLSDDSERATKPVNFRKRRGRKQKAQNQSNNLEPTQTMCNMNVQKIQLRKMENQSVNTYISTTRNSTLFKSNLRSKRNCDISTTSPHNVKTRLKHISKTCTQVDSSSSKPASCSKIVLKRDSVDSNNSKSEINIALKEKYNYVYKNNRCRTENLLKLKRVKIILPHHLEFSVRQRTCIIRVPVWSLQGTRLPTIISPLIREVCNLSTPDATTFLQDYINNYFNVLQVDGNGLRINFRQNMTNGCVNVSKKIKDTSDIDSDDDLTDEENAVTAFECENQIMCQFNDIKHNRYKWWIDLKDGMMCINGKDYLFKAAKGVVHW